MQKKINTLKSKINFVTNKYTELKNNCIHLFFFLFVGLLLACTSTTKIDRRYLSAMNTLTKVNQSSMGEQIQVLHDIILKTKEDCCNYSTYLSYIFPLFSLPKEYSNIIWIFVNNQYIAIPYEYAQTCESLLLSMAGAYAGKWLDHPNYAVNLGEHVVGRMLTKPIARSTFSYLLGPLGDPFGCFMGSVLNKTFFDKRADRNLNVSVWSK